MEMNQFFKRLPEIFGAVVCDGSLVETSPLNAYEMDQIRLLAIYHPYDFNTVKHVFYCCGKSIDRTIRALELGTVYNSIDCGVEKSKSNAFATVSDWFEGCGFRFFHSTDRYGQFGHTHVFVASMDDMNDTILGLEGCDEDSFAAVDTLLANEKKENCFIGYDNDPVEAIAMCVKKIIDYKSKLDASMAGEIQAD